MGQKTAEIDLIKLANENNHQFKIHPHSEWILIRVFAPLTENALADLEAGSNLLMATKVMPVLLDCKDQVDLSPLWTRFVVKMAQFLHKKNSRMVGTNCSDRFRRFLQAQGLNSSLPPTEKMEDALAKAGIQRRHGLDVNLVNPFLAAAIETIQSQLQVSCAASGLTMLPPNAPMSGDISGIIRLDCQTLKAVVIISFPKETIFGMVGKLTGARPVTMTSMVKGSVGEITNITFTLGKRQLNEMGYGVESAVPSLTEEQSLPEDFMEYTGKAVSVAFTTEFGPYYGEIRLRQAS